LRTRRQPGADEALHFIGDPVAVGGVKNVQIGNATGDKVRWLVAELTHVGRDIVDWPTGVGLPFEGHDRTGKELATIALNLFFGFVAGCDVDRH